MGYFQYECPMWEKKANYDEIENMVEQKDEPSLITSLELKEGKTNEWFLDSRRHNHMNENKD